MEGVTLDTFIDFLSLCESNGFIELKLCLEELREKLQSLLDSAQSTSPAVTCDDVACYKGERSSLSAEKEFNYDATHSLSLSFDFQLSAIRTPETVSTPLSAEEQTNDTDSDCSFHCRPRGEVMGSGKGPSSSSRGRSIAEEVQVECVGDSPQNHGKDSSTSGSSNIEQSCHSPRDDDIEGWTTAATRQLSSTSDNVSSVDLKRPMPSFNLDEGLSMTGDSRKDCIDVDHHDIGEDTAREEEVWSKKCVSVRVKQEVEESGSCDNHVILLDSSDDDADDKLEKLFSDMKIHSSKKIAPKHVSSRKSLAVFIVSDSEEVEVASDNEENPHSSATNLPSKTPPTYHTPCTPSSGIMFWGSPSTDFVKVQTTGSKRYRRPLGQQNFYDTPSVLHLSTPQGKAAYLPPPLTTPSANKNFSRFKTSMIQELYDLFNRTIFDNKLPSDMRITWNKKLRTTAGYCCYEGGFGARSARIELSTKVVDCYDRIRDTLVHEMCHAATWIIDGIKGGGHGREWRAWAEKANDVYPDLKPITRCHSYQIQYKYTYKCTTCDFTTGRHSKSVNLARARCPCCLSKLELLPRLKVDGTPATERKLNRYAQFVKDHYGEVKSGSPWRNHKEIMERLKEIYHQNSQQTAPLASS